MKDKIKEFIKNKLIGDADFEAVINVIEDFCKQENQKANTEIERLKTEIEYILWLVNKKNPHLGRPRLSDKKCIYCMGYFAINNGSFGYSLTTNDYKKLISEFKVNNS